MYRINDVKEMAKHFAYKPDSCLVMAEIEGGSSCEIVLSGDFMAMVHCTAGIIHRMAELSGSDYQDMLKAINDIHDLACKAEANDLESEDDDGKYKEI